MQEKIRFATSNILKPLASGLNRINWHPNLFSMYFCRLTLHSIPLSLWPNSSHLMANKAPASDKKISGSWASSLGGSVLWIPPSTLREAQIFSSWPGSFAVELWMLTNPKNFPTWALLHQLCSYNFIYFSIVNIVYALP